MGLKLFLSLAETADRITKMDESFNHLKFVLIKNGI
jgi:ssDNA-specific exonuclease RecJ